MTAILWISIILTAPSGNAALEQRVLALSQQLRCLVCQNQTIADSQADLASDLRDQIRDQMLAGKTDTEITTFLTARYGDFVLYRPPVKPQTWALWYGPFVALAFGLFALYGFLKRWPTSVKHRSLSAAEHRHASALLLETNNPSVEIYREQFAEIETDYRNGALNPDQFERDREELERRLLEDCGSTR